MLASVDMGFGHDVQCDTRLCLCVRVFETERKRNNLLDWDRSKYLTAYVISSNSFQKVYQESSFVVSLVRQYSIRG